MKCFSLLFVAVFGTVLSKDLYEDFKVFRLNPSNEEQKIFLTVLERNNRSLDFWNGVNKVGAPVDVMVKPESQQEFLELMRRQGIAVKEMIENVASRIYSEDISKRTRYGGMTWDRFHTLGEINSWLKSLSKKNQAVTMISAGKSYEGRDIRGVKVSFKEGNRGVFIEGGIHAREWISPATVTFILNEVLNSSDPAFAKIARNFDWHIFPVTNPDGYAYTHSTNRLWRKTRTPYGNCFGADPNRNWGIHWGEVGTSTSPCSDIYGGPKVFSENETSSMADYITTIGSSLDVFLSFHFYSQLLLIPYGHTSAPLDNYEDVKKIGDAACKSLASRYGTIYKVGNIAEMIYPVSGSSIDWIKQEFKVPIAYTYEMRDSGEYGFLLPADQIKPNCEEVMDSIVTIFSEAEKIGYFSLA